MSAGAATSESSRPIRGAAAGLLRADSLAAGVSVMLLLAAVQRGVGFIRDVLFCRFLEDGELGQWSLIQSFFILAAPLIVLGIPGCFGRYVERYRGRGQLHSFLSRSAAASAASAVLGLSLMLLLPGTVSRLVFGDAEHLELVRLMAAALAVTVAFNFSIELLTALRQVRFVAVMQFTFSLTFAVFGVTLAGLLGWGVAGIVAASSAAGICGILLAGGFFGKAWINRRAAVRSGACPPLPPAPLSHSSMWSQIAPYVAWTWAINLLANLFEAADRYMIIHFAPLSAEGAQSLVGQYHSSRVVPVLMLAFAGMLSAAILPYLSHDWEAGRREDVGRRLRLAIKLAGLAFMTGSTIVLFAAPLLFGWALAGRYDDGLSVLPGSLAYCAWGGLAVLTMNYLWCAERARLAALAFGCGLALNCGLNYMLVPPLGLSGAVFATAAANFTMLLLGMTLARRAGLRAGRGVWLTSAMPALLLGGPWIALAGLAVFAAAAAGTNLVFDETEKCQLSQLVQKWKKS